MEYVRLPFRKAPRRDSRYRCGYRRARRTPARATCNERFPVLTRDWSQPAKRFLSWHGWRNFLFGKFCNAEVEYFHVSVSPKHDVLRLDVAMNNSRFVCGGERTCYLDCDVNGLVQPHRR